jgi:hypothetical protein
VGRRSKLYRHLNCNDSQSTGNRRIIAESQCDVVRILSMNCIETPFASAQSFISVRGNPVHNCWKSHFLACFDKACSLEIVIVSACTVLNTSFSMIDACEIFWTVPTSGLKGVVCWENAPKEIEFDRFRAAPTWP